MARGGSIGNFFQGDDEPLSLYDKHKNTIPENGGDEALLAALANGPLPARQAAAARHLTNLSWSPEIRSRLCSGGAIPSLVLLLGEEDPQASDTAVKALYNLASTNHAKVPSPSPSLWPLSPPGCAGRPVAMVLQASPCVYWNN